MSLAAIAAQGTTLHVAGTGGAAKTITGAAPGFPTVVTSTAHGLANGDSITIASIVGTMATIMNVAGLVVQNVTANTFSVAVNTTGLAYTSGGTATPLAWIKVGNIKGFKPSNPTTSERVTTDLDSTAVETGGGLTDYGNVALDNFVIVDDAGQAAMQALFISKAITSFKVTYPSGTTPIRTFPGWVKDFPDMGDASIDGSVSGTITIRRTGVAVAS